ncbi:MAG: hypothetical protein WB715_09320 [Roseiarcus sp.]|uniref:hypothetical protein n=1 Tax=Roseiarcus sp. TaxID=1969460 RepID=UPI003C593DC2
MAGDAIPITAVAVSAMRREQPSASVTSDASSAVEALAVSPTTGEGLEFEVIAAVVIGGTGLYGGQGKILRTIIGVIIIALTRNFLNLARIAIFWQGFATGAIILAAVLLEALQRRISERR